MSVVSSPSKRRPLAFLTALMVFFALVVPLLSSAAIAQPAPGGSGVLDITPEDDTNPVGGGVHVLTATVTQAATNTAIEVDFEIDCLTGCSGDTYTVSASPNGQSSTTTAVDTPTDGNQTPGTLDDTRTSPELTCAFTTDSSGNGSCTVSYSRNNDGTEEIIGWIDADKSNTTDESDSTEQQSDTAGGQQTAEPDDTDVVTKTWFTDISTDIYIDCEDQTNNFNNQQTDSDAEDYELNQTGQSETYTCTVRDNQGTTGSNDTADDTPVAGVKVDLEREGANDPDNLGFDSVTNLTVDSNDVCTTDAAGQCTIVIAPIENEAGFSELCFFIDADSDAQFSNTGTDADGGNCDADDDGAEGTDDSNQGFDIDQDGDDDNPDRTEITEKEWRAPGTAAIVDASPEVDSNPTGTSHSVTAVVTDEFGNLVPNARVDFNVYGRNQTVNPRCNDVITNAQGQASCTYNDVGAATPVTGGADPNRDEDVIVVCIDQNQNNGCDDTNTTENQGADATEGDTQGRAAGDEDAVDVVLKFWFAGAVPTVDEVILDGDANEEEDNGTPGDCGTDDNEDPDGNGFDTTATNTVGVDHIVCVRVENAANQRIPGVPVTFDLSGPGDIDDDPENQVNFFFGPDSQNCTADGGKSVTVNTDENGEAYIAFCSEATGTTTVTARAGGKSDTSTKLWVADAGRNIDCTPETATNQINTTHTVSCLVTDAFGNPVNGELVSFQETGAGSVTKVDDANNNCDNFYGPNAGCINVRTDNTGTAEATFTSATAGTQTIEACFEDDCDTSDSGDRAGAPADDDDVCDARANEGTAFGNLEGPNSQPGAPAGNCADEVTKTWVTEIPPAEPECSDGLDNDNDGQTDFPNDPDCSNVEDDSETDVGGRFESNISIRYNRAARPRAFKGKVGSPRAECKAGRLVRLKKVVPGPNRTVGQDTTNENGNWRVVKRRARGRFYAVVRAQSKVSASGATLVCGGDRSVTIRVRRR